MRISDWSSDVFSSDLGARQFLEQRLLGALIRHRDEIGRPLAADLEVLDLVEITPQPRRRLACGPIHDGDEARMRYHRVSGRSEERRVGKECVSTCISRWWPHHYKKKQYQ